MNAHSNMRRLIVAVALSTGVFLGSTLPAATIWYEDNNLGQPGGTPADFVTKFATPEQFRKATGYIDVYMIRAKVLDRMDDRFIKDVLSPYLTTNGIKLAVDTTGATWSQRAGRKRIADSEMALYERLNRLKLRVDYISLQSVLSKDPGARSGKAAEVDYPLASRIEDIVGYARAVTAIYPQAQIGIIDALPSHGKEYRVPYRQVRDALVAAGLRLSYIHLDMPFEIPQKHQRGITWQTVLEVEKYIEDDLGLTFGYFATSRRGGHTSSKAYHDNVIADLECYAGFSGTPGDYVIASWFPHPRYTVPEFATGDEYPTMRTVVVFGQTLDTIERNGTGWIAKQRQSPDWRSKCGLARGHGQQ